MTQKFESEAAMCAEFLKDVAPLRTWTAYPETAGWDILLVRRDGLQIGIQAKLAMNAAVLTQALEQHYELLYERQGPDFRAVLVPESKARGWGTICDHLGITIIRVGSRNYRRRCYEPDLPNHKRGYLEEQSWFDRCPSERIKLPDYVPDVAAGKSAPVQLTDWKIRAIKIVILCEKRGYVTRADFAELKISISRWLTMAWLKYHPEPAMRGAFVAHRLPDFETQHPRNYAEIEADFEKWKPKPPGMLAEIPLPASSRETVAS